MRARAHKLSPSPQPIPPPNDAPRDGGGAHGTCTQHTMCTPHAHADAVRRLGSLCSHRWRTNLNPTDEKSSANAAPRLLADVDVEGEGLAGRRHHRRQLPDLALLLVAVDVIEPRVAAKRELPGKILDRDLQDVVTVAIVAPDAISRERHPRAFDVVPLGLGWRRRRRGQLLGTLLGLGLRGALRLAICEER
jgi:hypothetical protein